MSYYDDLRAGDEEMIREWGRPVKLRGKTDPIIAIFNEPYARVDVPHAGFITGTVTSLTALSDDVAGVVARDVVQVPKQRSIEPDGSVTWSGWTDYVVKEPQPDGTGLTNIFRASHVQRKQRVFKILSGTSVPLKGEPWPIYVVTRRCSISMFRRWSSSESKSARRNIKC